MSAAQKSLLGRNAIPVATKPLGPAQLRILRALRLRGFLYAEEAGAMLHARAGKHRRRDGSRRVRCIYCHADGTRVLASLRRRKPPLVVRRTAGYWEPIGPPATHGPGDEFPEGF